MRKVSIEHRLKVDKFAVVFFRKLLADFPVFIHARTHRIGGIRLHVVGSHDEHTACDFLRLFYHDAIRDSRTVMVTSCLPLPLNDENLKYSPAENAIKAKAISEINAESSIIFCGTAFRQNGPIIIPAIIYAVTFGNFKRLVMRVVKKPLKRIIASARITADTGDEEFNFSYKLSIANHLLCKSAHDGSCILNYMWGVSTN